MTAINLKKEEDGQELPLLNSILNDEIFNEEIREELIKTNSNEEFIQTLMKYDKNSNYDYFMNGYLEWSLNETKNLSRLSNVSRLRNLLGSFIYGTPESQGMPFYFYYTNQDKVRSAPFHFSTKDSNFNKYRLFVNRYTRYFRQKMTNRLSVGLIIFGLLMGFIIKPVLIEFKEQIQLISDVSKIKDIGESNNEKSKENILKDKASNLEKAKQLKEKYESGEITAEEFNIKASDIKNLDIKYDNLIKRNEIINKAETEINIAYRKKKDSDYIQDIRSRRDEELKQLENKGE